MSRWMILRLPAPARRGVWFTIGRLSRNVQTRHVRSEEAGQLEGDCCAPVGAGQLFCWRDPGRRSLLALPWAGLCRAFGPLRAGGSRGTKFQSRPRIGERKTLLAAFVRFR